MPGPCIDLFLHILLANQIHIYRIALYLSQAQRQKGSDFPLRNALGYIMEGEVEFAVTKTLLFKTWSCLPGGGNEQQITMEELCKRFNRYFQDLEK